MKYSLKPFVVFYRVGLPNLILQPSANGHHFIGRNATYGIVVKNSGDYHRTLANIQIPITEMLKKAKIRAICEPQNMFHGLVIADILKQYCD